MVAGLILAVLAIAAIGTPANAVWLEEQVKDGPAAADTRESFRLLEQAEESIDESTQTALYRRGLEAARRAVKIDPKSADAQFAYFGNWGRIMQRDGWMKNAFQLSELLGYLERAIELNPNHADALAARGGLYRQLPGLLGGDSAKAEEFLKRAIALDAGMSGGRLELAELYLADGRDDEGKQLVVDALRIARGTGKQRYVRRALALCEEIGVSPSQILIKGP